MPDLRIKLLILEAAICLIPATLFWIITLLVVIVPVWHHPLESSLQVLLLAPAAVGLYGSIGLLVRLTMDTVPGLHTIAQAGIGLLTAVFLGLTALLNNPDWGDLLLFGLPALCTGHFIALAMAARASAGQTWAGGFQERFIR